MSRSREALQVHGNAPGAADGGRRNRLFIAVLLLGLTIAGGVAAKRATDRLSPMPVVDPEVGQLQFSAPASGPVGFGGQLDRTSVMLGGDGLVKLELLLQGEASSFGSPSRVPTDLVVVLDRSGSMRGDPMAHALASVRELIGHLSSEDRFALITYASHADAVIRTSPATPEARRGWLSTLSQISVGGGTNMASGLDLATETVGRMRAAGRVPRVILVSDGHANEGDHSRAGLVGRAARAVVGEYGLSAVGVGSGFDEALMTALADAGTGNFYYVERSEELGEIFGAEFAAARQTLATGLEVAVETAPGVEVVSAAGYPLVRDGRRVSFRPGSLFAGQQRRIWVTLRAPAQGATAIARQSLPLGDFSLTYSRAGVREALRFSQQPTIALVEQERDFYAGMNSTRWEEAVAGEELGELKQSLSRDIEAGDRKAARRRIDSFVAKQRTINRHVQSPKVDEVISSVGVLEAEVAGAFEADDEDARSRLRKKYSAEGYDSRRQGAKY